MKILYAANNSIDSNRRALRISQNNPNWDIRIAGFTQYFNKNITWNLNALHIKKHTVENKKKLQELFGYNNVPKINYDKTLWLLEDINQWQPELIVNDLNEQILHIAYLLGIKLISCSPFLKQPEGYLKHITYSPFGSCLPYTETPKKHKLQVKINKGMICSAQTSLLTDALLQGPIAMFVNPDSEEEIYNAKLVEEKNFGLSLGKENNNSSYLRERIEEFNEKKFNEFKPCMKRFHEQIIK